MSKKMGFVVVVGVLSSVLVATVWAGDTTPQAQLAEWSAQAGRAGDAASGATFFSNKHGREWACANCHHTPPTREGAHAVTGKVIRPLAPAFNPQAFTSSRKVNKWFRRNCGDVLGRECSSVEKADVMAYLLSLKN